VTSIKTMKKSTKAVVKSGRDTAVRVGKVAKSAAVAGAKAGAAAALAAGALEAEKSWRESSPAAKKKAQKGALALLAGVAVLGAAGIAIARSRKNKKPAGA
jgi:hypothetical protein